MNALNPSDTKRSRLWIVFETFALLGAIMHCFTGSVIPLLVAGALFCICALSWRTEAEERKYRTTWIALALGGFMAGTVVAIYLRK